MPEIDAFAAQLFEEAKRFLELAALADDITRKDAFLHAALLLAFSALEAHINAMCEEFSGRPELSAHEKALLLEQDVRLENGAYKLGGFKMYKLEERITFLHRRFSGKPLSKTEPWWGALHSAIDMRNKLTHPKGAQTVSYAGVQSAISAIIDSLDALYQAIYKKRFPAANRGLSSRLTF